MILPKVEENQNKTFLCSQTIFHCVSHYNRRRCHKRTFRPINYGIEVVNWVGEINYRTKFLYSAAQFVVLITVLTYKTNVLLITLIP